MVNDGEHGRYHIFELGTSGIKLSTFSEHVIQALNSKGIKINEIKERLKRSFHIKIRDMARLQSIQSELWKLHELKICQIKMTRKSHIYTITPFGLKFLKEIKKSWKLRDYYKLFQIRFQLIEYGRDFTTIYHSIHNTSLPFTLIVSLLKDGAKMIDNSKIEYVYIGTKSSYNVLSSDYFIIQYDFIYKNINEKRKMSVINDLHHTQRSVIRSHIDKRVHILSPIDEYETNFISQVNKYISMNKKLPQSLVVHKLMPKFQGIFLERAEREKYSYSNVLSSTNTSSIKTDSELKIFL